MKVLETRFQGVYIIENNLFEDNRGNFQKLFQSSVLQEKGVDFTVGEHFFSTSQKGVIRGMHFQLPPFAQSKLVYVLQGAVKDVIVDLRKGSSTYLKHLSFELKASERKALLIPEGFAHGFQALENHTIMVYLQTKEFNSGSDFGINPFSIDMDWPIKNHVISQKDESLVRLDEFSSPF